MEILCILQDSSSLGFFNFGLVLNIFFSFKALKSNVFLLSLVYLGLSNLFGCN